MIKSFVVTEDPQHPYGLKVNGEVKSFATTAEMIRELDRIDNVLSNELARTEQRKREEAAGEFRKRLEDFDRKAVETNMRQRDTDRGITAIDRINRARHQEDGGL